MFGLLRNRIIIPLLIPAALLLCAWFLYPLHSQLPASLIGLISFGPYGLLTILLLLGLAYNRGKLILACLLLASGLFLADQRLSVLHWTMEQVSILDLALLGWVPANIAYISICRERGVFSPHTLVRFTVISIQALVLLAVFFYPDQSPLTQQFRMQLMNAPFLSPAYNAYEPLMAIPFTHTIQTLLIVSSLTIFFALFLQQTQFTFGLLGAYAGYVIAAALLNRENLLAVNTIAGSLILCIALLRDSYNMAYRDELTQLPQRRALNERLLSLGNNYTLAMLDIDHFKKFNDQHGHEVGDQVLQMVASRINKVRGSGKAFRFGGEEFTIVFPSTGTDDATFFLEEVRADIENYEMVIRDSKRPMNTDRLIKRLRERGSYREADKKVSVTISIGFASKEHRVEKPDDVLKKADEALYRAKKAGRNQVAA